MEANTNSRTAFPDLLGADEPSAVEVVDVDADADAQCLFVCDHASPHVPNALQNLGLDPSVLERHVAWDIGSAAVARQLSARFRAPLVMSGYSRLVIDVNRHLDDASSIPVESDGFPIPGNRKLSPEAAAQRAELFFWPYHRAIAKQIDGIRKQGRVPALISVHSFTPQFGDAARPWHVGVLWHEDGRIAQPLMERLGARPGVCVGDNQPYSARNPYGYTIYSHAETEGLPHVLIELRQDLIASAAGAAEWAEVLGDAFVDILKDPDIYRILRSI